MREIASSITKRGQLTVPAEVRRILGLQAPDRVVFVVDEDAKTVRLEVPRYPSIDALVGGAGTLKEPMSWDDMREIARDERLMRKHGGKS